MHEHCASAALSTKPLFIAEYGVDSYSSSLQAEDQTTHAAEITQLAAEIARSQREENKQLWKQAKEERKRQSAFNARETALAEKAKALELLNKKDMEAIREQFLALDDYNRQIKQLEGTVQGRHDGLRY